MNKKIILLMLALPLILMLSLFTATSTVSLAIPVPVTSVTVHEEEDKFVYLSLGETYEIAYTVYPTNAANKDVSFVVKPLAGHTTAKVRFEENTIIPESCGEAEIFVRTIDGGYEDSFLLSVYSKELEGIESYVDRTTIAIGEAVQIETSFIPTNTPYAQRALGYVILNGEDVVKVSDVGKVTGIGVGEATVRVYCKVNEAVYCDVTLTVENACPIEFQSKAIVNTILESGGEIALYVDDASSWDDVTVTLSDDTVLSYALDIDNKRLTYSFTNDSVCEVTLTITITVGEEVFEDVCTITRVSEITAEWLNGDINGIIVYKGNTFDLYFELTPSSAAVTYSVTFEKDGLFTYDETALQSGVVKLTPVETANEDDVKLFLTITDEEGNEITLVQVLIVLN